MTTISPVFQKLIFFIILALSSWASAQNDEKIPARLFGDVTLTSDSIQQGLTQTDHSFALQTGLGYRWPQFKMGLWGSNVKFPDSDENLNLRLFLALNVAFSANVELSPRYDFNRYFKGGKRDGALVGVDLRVFDYHIIYDQNSNFEGRGIASTRWGFMHEWPIPWNLFLKVNAGYNMLKSSALTDYFDVISLVSYKGGDMTYSLGGNFNSNASQFNGQGDLAIFAQIAAQF